MLIGYVSLIGTFTLLYIDNYYNDDNYTFLCNDNKKKYSIIIIQIFYKMFTITLWPSHWNQNTVRLLHLHLVI